MRLRSVLLCLLAAVSFTPSEAFARDWFVRAAATDGDGSQAKPFADPWQALEKVQAGDAVHVAAGKYYGRLGQGTWAIPFDKVQLIGGYDASFKTRDPWTNHTQLLWDKTSKNWPKEVRLLSHAKDTVVDGVILDMRDQNQYADAAESGRTEKPGESAMRFTHPVTVRNSIILNPGQHGIECVPGSTIENNLILNAVGWGVSVYTSGGNFLKNTATIRNNTILFSWDIRKPGAGGYAGAAVQLNGPAIVTNNIIAHSDNNAIYITHAAEKISITKNLFFLNLFSNVKFYLEGRDLPIDDKSMDLLEEAGFKAFDGNEIKNHTLDLDPKWMDKYSQRTAATEGKVEMNDWNEMRKTLGLPMIGKGGSSSTGVAPPWELANAVKLLQPKNAAVKQGARKVKLEVKLSDAGASAAGPAKSYAPTDFFAWHKSPESVDGKAIEMVVAIGSVANIGGIPAQYDQKEHAGVVLYDKDGKGERVTGFYRKGTTPDRVSNENMGNYSGSGVPQRLFTVRGVAHALKGLPKAGLFLESVEPYSGGGAAAAARVAGRDWFVKAGAQGGDGSREKPFRDPFQALERAEAGDMIHVAAGEYNGKLRAGNWRIDTTNISLLGGYDADFKTRNPWKNPTYLKTAADFKGRRGGYTISGDQDDHSGAIIDGFVFDKRGNNIYTSTGDLDYSRSDKSDHIWLARPGCIIRNNVFLNGAEGALRLGGSGQLVENNIFINHWQKTVDAQGGFGSDPFVFRNNTAAFAWDMRFGGGKTGGNLLILQTGIRAQVDNNIFAFADNDAIRLNTQAKDVELTRNVFSHNLWSNVQKPDGWISVDDKEFAKLADFGWKRLEGNQVISPALPIDQKWFDVYLGRTAYTPGKVKMDDWNQLREVLGQPVIATGGKAGTGMAPAYDAAKALQLFPKNPKVTAGARASDLPVKFTGITRVTATHEYTDVEWEVAKSKDTWEKLDGKRVALKVVIRAVDNQYYLDDVKKEEFQVFTVAGPEGTESGGLPLRAYVKKGTRPERTMKQSKGYSSGQVTETHVIRGIARSNRQIVAEEIEKAD